MKDEFIDELSDLDDVGVLYKYIEVDTDFQYEWNELLSILVDNEVYELSLLVKKKEDDRGLNSWRSIIMVEAR